MLSKTSALNQYIYHLHSLSNRYLKYCHCAC